MKNAKNAGTTKHISGQFKPDLQTNQKQNSLDALNVRIHGENIADTIFIDQYNQRCSSREYR